MEQHLARHKEGKPVEFRAQHRRKRRFETLKQKSKPKDMDRWETDSQSSIVALLNRNELDDDFNLNVME